MYPTLRYRKGEQITTVVRGFMTPADTVAQITTLRQA
jgi:hypothetical protein